MLAIILVNYKSSLPTCKYIKEVLLKNVTIPSSVVIVDNASTSESVDEIKKNVDVNIYDRNFNVLEEGESSIYLICNPENSGFAKGNNLGARFATDVLNCDYLLFSNNDIEFIDSNVVEALYEKLKNTPKAGIIGPKVVGLQGEFQSPEPYVSFWDRNVWMYLSTPFYSKEKKRQRFQLDYARDAKEGFHYKLMGSFFMVRSKDFKECGMMDEHTFLYAEEPILTERMKRIGLQPYFYPQVAVLHNHGATTKKHFRNSQIEWIKFESECYYYRTYKNTSSIEIFIGRLLRYLLNIIKRNR